MKTKTLAEIRAMRPDVTDTDVKNERAAVDAAIMLHELRETKGVTQSDIAELLEVSRPRVSTIERANEDLRLSTMRRYVEALGGRLEMTAVFDDGPMKLKA